MDTGSTRSNNSARQRRMRKARPGPGTGSPPEFEVTIDKLVYGGAGLGRHDGKVVFVPFSVPGDRLVVRAVEQKKNFARAAFLRIIEPGEGRTAPPCTHFGRCGGCQWQQIEYTKQVDTKRTILEELVHHRFPETGSLRIGMRPAPQPYGYRSRARVQIRGFGTNTSVGFYRFESHAIEDVSSCPLLRPTLSAALDSVRETRRRGQSDPGVQEIELVSSEEEGRWASAEAGLAEEEGFSALGKPADKPEGSPLLHHSVAGFQYRVSPSVFFQANDFMLEELVSELRNLAALPRSASALDLFSGVGLFTLPLAQQFRQVVAIESSQEACRLCELNATTAGFDNIRVNCTDVGSWMGSLSSVAPPGFDLVVLDPPRRGAGPVVMRYLTQWAPETIIYVSCDPQTLCRDVALLPPRDYRIDFVEGLDLFPQTYHFETVMRLRRR